MEEVIKPQLSPPSPTTQPATPLPKKTKNRLPNFLVSFFSVSLIIVVVLATLSFFFVYVPAKKLLSRLQTSQQQLSELKAAVSDKNLTDVKKTATAIQSNIALIEKGRSEVEGVKRQKIYWELEKVLYDNCEDVWIFWEMGPSAYSKNIMGYNYEMSVKHKEIWNWSHPLWFKQGKP